MRWFYDPRAPWLILAALAVLLGVLGTLQYHWLGEVSQAERERLRAGLESAVERFARDFDRELTRAYLHFLSTFVDRPGDGRSGDGRTARMTPERLAPRLAEQLARWREVAPYPDLVRDVLWLERIEGGGWRVSRLDPPAAQFVDFEDGAGAAPDRLLTVTESFDAPDSRSRPVFLAPAVPAAVIPRFDLSNARGGREGRRSSWSSRARLAGIVLIRFDLEFLGASFLPTLGARYLARGETLDYDFAVLAPDAHGRRTVIFRSDARWTPEDYVAGDRRIGLFHLLPLAESRDLWREVRSESAGPDGRDERGRWAFERLFRWFLPPLEVREGGADGGIAGSPGGGATAGPGNGWLLAVRHQDGSLEAAVGRARDRNLAVSSAVLLLLGATVAMLLVSMRRARELAVRQVEFVAGITHELRTPLAAIRSLAQNLADGIVEKPDQARRYGTLIEKEGGRLSAMVEQVLELSGILSERGAYTLERVAVPGIVTRAVDECRSQPAGDVRFEQRIAPGVPDVRADPPALQRAVRNLVANAVKYGGDGGWVGVEVFPAPPHEVAVRVSDRGPGIARAELPRLFEAFYRGRDAAEAQIPGSGLGLSLVKHVVDAHGGRVEVDSEKPRGSSFTIFLPALEPEDGESPDPGG